MALGFIIQDIAQEKVIQEKSVPPIQEFTQLQKRPCSKLHEEHEK